MKMFRDETWEQREKTLGDPAENAFRQWADNRQLAYVRFGLERPPIDMRRVPTMLRYTPDFLTDQGLFEVQGCGQDQKFKFKHDKLFALRWWNRQADTTQVWLWNQPLDTCVTCHIEALFRYCWEDATLGLRTDGLFDGTKPYAEVTWSKLTGIT